MVQPARIHVESIELKGKLTPEQLNAVLANLDRLLAERGRVGLVVDLSEFRDAQAEGFVGKGGADFALLRQLERIPRLAIVADRQWLGAALTFLQRYLPATELRLFRTGEQAEATFWAGEPATRPHGASERGAREPGGTKPGMSASRADRDDLLIFEIDGRVEEDAMEDVAEAVSRAYKRHGKVDLMVRIRNWDGFDPRALFDDDIWKVKVGAFRHLRRYAVVGGPGWMASVAGFADRFSPFEIRTFTLEEEDEARLWLDG